MRILQGILAVALAMGALQAHAQKYPDRPVRAIADPGVRGKLETLGNQTMIMTSAEFAKFVRREIADTAKIVKAAGIKPQ